MDESLNPEQWLKAMKLIDPDGHDERCLRLTAERYGVDFKLFLTHIERSLVDFRNCSEFRWGWAVLNDIDLMASFYRYRETTLLKIF